MRPPSDSPRRRRLRLWPAVVVLVLAAIALSRVWVGPALHRQERVLGSIVTVGLGGAALAGWWLLLSRASWRLRLGGLGCAVAALALAVVLVEPRGVSGDVLPVLGWRFGGQPEALAPGGPVPPQAPRPASAHDWPQFLGGPRRDGRVHGVRLHTGWASRPPRLAWRRPVGAGWSGFAVSGDHAVTQEQDGELETVRCYDARTGERLWSHEVRARHDDPLGGPGPRATPAIAGGRVFAVGATGILSVLELASGRPLWSRELTGGGRRGESPTYGLSASPLVDAGRVIVAAAGGGPPGLLALEAATGVVAWSAGEGGPAYSSPALATLAGVPQVLLFDEAGLGGHDPATGRSLWSVDWPAATERVSQPVALPADRLFLSTGYGVGGKLYRVRAREAGGLEATLLWESRGLKAKLSNVVFHDGHLYGLDDGIMACLDLAGDRCWKAGRYGHGQLVVAGDVLVVMAEDGRVALVAARSDGHRELASMQALDGKTWNHPALAGLRLIVRNDREAACWELPGELYGPAASPSHGET